MSDLRIALIAEGTTDEIVIDAALRAILKQRTYVLTLLQPEETDALGGHAPTIGGGWGGVYRWCLQKRAMSPASGPHAMLEGYDLVLFHVDADVARAHYSEAGIQMATDNELPCALPCPPAMDTVNALRAVVAGWPGLEMVSQQPVYCIPSQSSETWMVAALFEEMRSDILECRDDLEQWLSRRPKNFKLVRMKQGHPKKQKQRYRNHAATLTRNWEAVKEACATARLFEEEMGMALR